MGVLNRMRSNGAQMLPKGVFAVVLAVAMTFSACGQAPNLPNDSKAPAQTGAQSGDAGGGSAEAPDVVGEAAPEPATAPPPPPPATELPDFETVPPPAPAPVPPKSSAQAPAVTAPKPGGSSISGFDTSRGLTPREGGAAVPGKSVTPTVGIGGVTPAPYQVVPVFYGTDRTEEPNAKRINYGSGRSHVLQLGKALVTVPAVHKAPKIERPWLIEIPYFKVKVYEQKEDPTKHFTIQEIKSQTREQLLADVKSILGQSQTFKNHAFVFVHGFNTSFDNAIYRTAQISYDMKFDGAAFVYSWPSGGNVASYTYDSGSTEQAEPHLKSFLEMVIKESGATSISLIAHSMGNELLLRVLERLEPEVPEGVEVSQIIFAAPDVDRDKFRILAANVSRYASGVTLYAAANDRALGYSARFWGGVPRAGDVPNGQPIIVPGIDSIDVTAVSTDSLGLNHSGYAENRALLDDIKQLLLTGTRPPDKRVPPIPKVTSQAGDYWRFAPAN